MMICYFVALLRDEKNDTTFMLYQNQGLTITIANTGLFILTDTY